MTMWLTIQVISSKIQRKKFWRKQNFLNNDIETKDLIKPPIRKEHHSTKVNTCLTKEGAFNDKAIKSIQKKLKEEKLIITKADKGNCIVIVKKEVYNQKILELLNNNGIKEKMIAISTLIKRTEELLEGVEFVFGKQLVQKLRSHKSDRIEEIPIRPVVVHCNSPSYKIAKWLTKYYNQLSNNIAQDRHIKQWRTELSDDEQYVAGSISENENANVTPENSCYDSQSGMDESENSGNVPESSEDNYFSSRYTKRNCPKVRWSKVAPSKTGRTRAHNIIIHLPDIKPYAEEAKSPMFSIIF
ncbi:hypothetical protein HHI36_016673 [Cryptolaemus montrouzieri]|uniref:Uncharacterized protein n=1 Tax=Cryptolaemus montrouzieri TaxID=559131 RepID=A0ABD2NKM6_9CUCU